MMLLNILFFILFLGTMAVTLTTLLIADFKVQSVNLQRPRALYAAQAGIEYALRGVLEYARSNSSLGGLHNYTETVNTGGGGTAAIKIQTVGTDSVILTSTGYSASFSQTVTKGINYTDVSNYAVYSTGPVSYVKTIPSGLIKQNATKMPVFDLDYLRDRAKPTQYFNGNLNLNSTFSLSNDIVFVEGNLQFGRFNWINVGHYVVGGNTRVRFSWWPFGFTLGTIYQFTPGNSFLCQWQWLYRELNGGMLANGPVYGTSKPSWGFRFYVRHNRSRFNSLLQYSVNGGPLVINNSSWRRKH